MTKVEYAERKEIYEKLCKVPEVIQYCEEMKAHRDTSFVSDCYEKARAMYPKASTRPLLKVARDAGFFARDYTAHANLTETLEGADSALERYNASFNRFLDIDDSDVSIPIDEFERKAETDLATLFVMNLIFSRLGQIMQAELLTAISEYRHNYFKLNAPTIDKQLQMLPDLLTGIDVAELTQRLQSKSYVNAGGDWIGKGNQIPVLWKILREKALIERSTPVLAFGIAVRKHYRGGRGTSDGTLKTLPDFSGESQTTAREDFNEIF